MKNNFKKIMLFGMMTTTLIGCHTHPLVEQWSYDEYTHWKDCTDIGCMINQMKYKEKPHKIIEREGDIIHKIGETDKQKIVKACKICPYVANVEDIVDLGGPLYGSKEYLAHIDDGRKSGAHNNHRWFYGTTYDDYYKRCAGGNVFDLNQDESCWFYMDFTCDRVYYNNDLNYFDEKYYVLIYQPNSQEESGNFTLYNSSFEKINPENVKYETFSNVLGEAREYSIPDGKYYIEMKLFKGEKRHMKVFAFEYFPYTNFDFRIRTYC